MVWIIRANTPQGEPIIDVTTDKDLANEIHARWHRNGFFNVRTSEVLAETEIAANGFIRSERRTFRQLSI